MDCEKCGEQMKCVETDSRQEWCEEIFACICGFEKTLITEFNQDGTSSSRWL